MAAEDEQGELLGFYWAVRDRLLPERFHLYLIVKPDQYRKGVGRRLFDDLLKAVEKENAKNLRISVRDTCPDCRAFAERRGFTEQRHQIAMELDLETFKDQAYDWLIKKLEGEGFQFTSMEALGNTLEAQRRLYSLNDTVASTTPSSGGEHPWGSFEDFQKRVCQADWYKPGGQMVVIDQNTSAWAAMSAITRLEGNDYAYNLFTGVDTPYRGRKLGQAVKVIALRYARNVLKASKVRTHHNTLNLPMIAIDRKFGYTFLPGTFVMEKDLVSHHIPAVEMGKVHAGPKK